MKEKFEKTIGDVPAEEEVMQFVSQVNTIKKMMVGLSLNLSAMVTRFGASVPGMERTYAANGDPLFLGVFTTLDALGFGQFNVANGEFTFVREGFFEVPETLDELRQTLSDETDIDPEKIDELISSFGH